MLLYKTVFEESVAEQTIEKSKFIAYMKPIENRQEADEFIKSIKDKHKDATHNVPAMVIGDKMQIQWASDDGEPQGTSGFPILHLLTSQNITNVAVVVTRYFGGKKLGTGGLVRAYSSTAKLALESSKLAEVKELISLTFKIDYTYLSNIQKLGEEGVFFIKNIIYEEKIIIECLTDDENTDNIIKHIGEKTNGKFEILDEKVEIQKVLSKK